MVAPLKKDRRKGRRDSDFATPVTDETTIAPVFDEGVRILPGATGGPRGGALLVGLILPQTTRHVVEGHVDELAALADTAGFHEAGRALFVLRKITAGTYLGTGQAATVAQAAKAAGAGVVIIDEDLSPGQVKSLEKIIDLPVVDRSGLIIDIFAQHARSREARTQVEMAQLHYLLPRLAGRWAHLSRQVGGGPGGTKGEGEKQIELDRRLVRQRIDHLRGDLKRIDRARGVRRRTREGTPAAALVGYTNVGKSSLFNALCNAGAFVQNQLFATLDSTVRRVDLGQRGTYLLKDTVGFIRKLPHDLVASFRSTFDEAAEADLLLLVVDLAHPAGEEQRRAAEQALADNGLTDRPFLVVYNKADGVGAAERRAVEDRDPDALVVSAKTGEGITRLSTVIADRLLGREVSGTIFVPAHRGDVVALAHRLGLVDRVEPDGELMRVTLRASRERLAQIQQALATPPREDAAS